MKKVITYGTYDMLHYGHIRLLERAKALGDYLIVGVTADDYDKSRGKINVQHSLSERIEAVKETGIADEVIVEEYEGQKIDDIQKYDIDIFTVGSDWRGVFDYLGEYCKVVYLDRTQGVSSTELREKKSFLTLGVVGNSPYLNKIVHEVRYVNGIKITGICTNNLNIFSEEVKNIEFSTNSLEELAEKCNALFVHSNPVNHYHDIKKLLELKKHVLCEAPLCLNAEQWDELHKLAVKNRCVLMDGLRTAYSTAFHRLLLLAKAKKIGKVYSVDVTCTSLKRNSEDFLSSISDWGPTAMLPVFQILGVDYKQKIITAHYSDKDKKLDTFTKIDFIYPDAVASIKVGNGVKSEGDLVISGTEGYIYVPAPWWKTDYFEIRYENLSDNKRYFYQLDGEGIRAEFAAFSKTISNGSDYIYIDDVVSREICQIVGEVSAGKDVVMI